MKQQIIDDFMGLRLDVIKNELALITSYPNSYRKISCEIDGIGFFPGACGIWNYQTEQSIRDIPIMIVGNDFGTEKSFNDSLKRHGEDLNGLTWRNLLQMLTHYGIDKEQCFFTNAIVGVRKDGSAIGKSPAINDKEFIADCVRFLGKQIEVQKPELVIVIGLQALEVISELSGALVFLKVIKTYQELDVANLSKIIDVSINGVLTNFVFLTHPSYWHLNVRHRKIGALAGINAEKFLISQVYSSTK